MKRNEKGFGAVEVILLVVIVGLLGGAGWYVYNSQKATNENLDNAKSSLDAAKAAREKQASTTSDATADWTTFTSSEGKYELKHPKSWVKADSLDQCNPGLLLIAANSASVGTCGSGNFGQMAVSSASGDLRSNYTKGSVYDNLSEKEVKIGTATGIRQESVVKSQPGEESVSIYPAGTKVVTYLFYTNEKTYAATYAQVAGYPEALTDFDTMITKTLKFLN